MRILALLLIAWLAPALLPSRGFAQHEDPEELEEPAAEMPLGQRIVDQAFLYKGTRYRFGGRTKQGLDCAGLVGRVWEDLELGKLPGACSALFKLGRAIGPEEAQPGDLIFFENTYRHGISHVGIYIGDEEFIHASRGRGVAVSKITDPYYLKHLAGGRRLQD